MYSNKVFSQFFVHKFNETDAHKTTVNLKLGPVLVFIYLLNRKDQSVRGQSAVLTWQRARSLDAAQGGARAARAAAPS